MRAANRRPGKESTLTRASWPTRIRAESTSSIGALMKIEVRSTMSNTGGIGMAGGAGVAHSPTSVMTSAIRPSNGAIITVFRSSTSVKPIAASARFTLARAPRQAAAAALEWLAASSSMSGETICSLARRPMRANSRSARSAVRQACSLWASAASRSRRARLRLARCVASSSRSTT
jgi:hypothetical protein